MSKDKLFDVFLSHSSKDKAQARDLYQRLSADGLRVWFDEKEVLPGDMIGRKIEEGLSESRVLLLLMSEHAFQSEWATLESWTFRYRDPTNGSRRFIPIRLDDADIAESLRQFAWIDWRTKSSTEYQRLLTACRTSEAAEKAPIRHSKARNRAKLLLPGDCLYGVSVARDGLLAFAGTQRGGIQAFDLSSFEKSFTLCGHTDQVRAVTISSDNKFLVSGSYDWSVRVWDISSKKELHRLAHQSTVATVAISPDNNTIFCGCVDGSLAIWKKHPGHFCYINKFP